jgi:hypothetical protein
MQIAAPREKQTALLVSKFHQHKENNQCNVAGLLVTGRKTFNSCKHLRTLLKLSDKQKT